MSDLTNHYIGHDYRPDPLDEIIRFWRRVFRVVFWALCIFGLIMLCSSCRSHQCGIGDTLWLHDTLTVYQQQRDSIFVHDSIHEAVTVRNDSVVVIKDRWHTQYRDRLVHDSVYVSKCDTIVRIVEKEKPLRFIDELRLHIANIAVFFVGIVALLWLLRRKFGV